MKVVLDEGVPRQLVSALREHGIEASRFDRSWTGITNGDLLNVAEAAGYDVLLTNDKNMSAQQRLHGRRIAVVALPHNKRRKIMERVPDIVDTLSHAKAGSHIVMGLDGRRIATNPLADGSNTEELPAVKPFGL